MNVSFDLTTSSCAAGNTDPLRAHIIGGADMVALAMCYRLRYEYFVLQKGWVKPDSPNIGHESDRYDSASYHLAVFSGEHLVAYLRALPWTEGLGFMLEHDFKRLLTSAALNGIRREHSLEVSRLAFAPSLPTAAIIEATELLFRLLYRCCQEKDIGDLYVVVEAGWLRRFKSCFQLHFQPLAPAQRFADGTKTVAAHASITELEGALFETDPEKLSWYQSE